MNSQTIIIIVATVFGILGLALLLNAGDSIIKFLSKFFVTLEQYNKDKQAESDARTTCRNGIYSEIKKKADSDDVKRLDKKIDEKFENLSSQNLKIIEGQAEIKAYMNVLLGKQGIELNK